MKHLICYSGGHSSALVAIEVARKYGTENLILLNHDINPRVEDADIKRFKNEVAKYLGVSITYANMPGWETKDQFDVCKEIGAFKVWSGQILCTYYLKTDPFYKWLDINFSLPPDLMKGTLYEAAHPSEIENEDVTIYYGFDMNEQHRIQRRSSILGMKGYKTDYPLALWERTIQSTKEIGIEPPGTYSTFKHANCIGCLKAGKQHWYIVYITRPDIWEKAKEAENEIGFSIKNEGFLEELEPLFEKMKQNEVPATEHMPSAQFWKLARIPGKQLSLEDLPCECVF